MLVPLDISSYAFLLLQDTADLLLASGKSQWIKRREDTVQAKGKGLLKTYWLDLAAESDSQGRGTSSEFASSISGGSVADQIEAIHKDDGTTQTEHDKEKQDRHGRLIDWNVDMLSRLLNQIASRRKQPRMTVNVEGLSLLPKDGRSTIDDVQEIIYLGGTSQEIEQEGAEIEPEALDQLRYFVTSVCAMYRHNSFHNFEHARSVYIGSRLNSIQILSSY